METPVNSRLIVVTAGIITTIVNKSFSAPFFSGTFWPMKNIKSSFWTLLLALSLAFFSFNLSAEESASKTIHCSHPELCRLSQIILNEHSITTYKFQTLVNISGDPHEYEPSSHEIKKLITAELLLVGPHELNPWIAKIDFQRKKIKKLTTLSLSLDKKDFDLYPKAGHEALSHFWLYPKIFCLMKDRLFTELQKASIIAQNIKNSNEKCLSQKTSIEKELSSSLAQIKLPLVLTHDALQPLFESLKPDPTFIVVAIKGSGHHHEATPHSVKKLYDALKAPKVIWIEEKGIHVPQNILSKKRKTDLVVTLDTANSEGLDYFQVLLNLNNKLKGLK
jgi:ABC-type Zn uptake system ZnuABC Zn-binding protein ZnuA